jgi:hypothetical protein
MFKCKVCAEKDLRISDLKSEIEALRTLVMPKGNSITTFEMNHVLNSENNVVELTPEQVERNLSIVAEQNLILTGDY